MTPLIPEKLQCEICNRRGAKVAYLRRKDGDVGPMHVCSDCARDVLRLHVCPQVDLERVFSEIERNYSTGKSPAYSCRLCGSTLAQIVADGKPGCCMCYLRFAGEIEQAVGLAQGRTRHVGKTPRP